MKLSSGEISRYLGISKSGLALYEKHGIVKADVDEDNGYHYYDRKCLNQLISAKGLREVGFSMDEIENLYETSDAEKAIGIYEEKYADLEKKMRLMQRKMDTLRMAVDEMHQIPEEPGKWALAESAGYYCLTYAKHDQLVKENQKMFQKLLKLRPIAFFCPRIAEDEFESGAYDWFYSDLAVQKVQSDLLDDEVRKKMIYHPSVMCLHTVVEESGQTSMKDMLVSLRKELDEKGYRLNGDILCPVFLLYGFNSGHYRYRNVWAPVVSA